MTSSANRNFVKNQNNRDISMFFTSLTFIVNIVIIIIFFYFLRTRTQNLQQIDTRIIVFRFNSFQDMAFYMLSFFLFDVIKRFKINMFNGDNIKSRKYRGTTKYNPLTYELLFYCVTI